MKIIPWIMEKTLINLYDVRRKEEKSTNIRELYNE